MRLHEMSSSEGRAERKLACQNSSADYSSELAGVVSWVRWVRATDAEEIEHGGLRLENCAAAEGADFDGGHGDGDLETAAEAGLR